MLKELHLQNFRCFKDHRIPFKKFTVIVGKNNAGKSTVVEALRVLSHIISKLGHRNPAPPPIWLDVPKTKKGVSPSIKSFDFLEMNLFHSYGDPPAVIKAKFHNAYSIEIYLGGGAKVFAILLDNLGNVVTSREASAEFAKNQFSTLPQIGPIAPEEKILSEEYVLEMQYSHLASAHFRNQLNALNSHFKDFCIMSEETWPRLRINEIQGLGGLPGDSLGLLVQDGPFVAECSWMGHGLQMWLQTIWFIVKTKKSSVVVLDEPDVYLHADLQRKLVRLLRQRDRQTIICTHSLEIMAEAYPDQILIIDRSKDSSDFASNLPAVQSVLNQLGSAANIHLARLWTSKKCILVEGKDIQILKILQDIIFPKTEEPFDRIPNFSVGGWGGWQRAKGSRNALKNSIGETITTYCIFDSDYHSSETKLQRLEDARETGIELHIWKRKELENYLIHPKAIINLMKKRGVAPLPTENDIKILIEEELNALREPTLDQLAENIGKSNRELSFSTQMRKARELVEASWSSFESKLEIVSGKDLISRLNQRLKISFSATSLARVIGIDEVPEEMINLITKIEKNERLESKLL